jgi:hypothetical protein
LTGGNCKPKGKPLFVIVGYNFANIAKSKGQKILMGKLFDWGLGIVSLQPTIDADIGLVPMSRRKNPAPILQHLPILVGKSQCAFVLPHAVRHEKVFEITWHC